MFGDGSSLTASAAPAVEADEPRPGPRAALLRPVAGQDVRHEEAAGAGDLGAGSFW